MALAALTLGASALATPNEAEAQGRHGGWSGGHAQGGVRGRAVAPRMAYRGGVRGYAPRGYGARAVRYGNTYRYGYRPGYRRVYGGYYGGNYPYWPLAAGLGILGLGIGMGYPYGAGYDYGYYPTVSPVYDAPVVQYQGVGGYCQTPQKTCVLYEPGLIGTGCSCRAPNGGRYRGGIVPR